MALEDRIVFTARSDGHIEGAPGVCGGQAGRPASLSKTDAKDKRTTLSSKVVQLSLAIGDTVRMEIPDGGGYGSLESDLLSGKSTQLLVTVDEVWKE